MVFSSLVFLFLFLPLVLSGYYVLHKSISLSNLFLFFMSILFYAYGEPKVVGLFLLTVALNWGLALCVEKSRVYGVMAIGLDIVILFYFKYALWTVGLMEPFVPFGTTFFRDMISVLPSELPIGISFYTFQAISYVADVMSGKTTAQKNPVYVGLYIAFFPQLIAGPIVRYTDVEAQLKDRCFSLDGISHGIVRFMKGCWKKILLADSMAVVVDKAFGLLNSGQLEWSFAWLGAIAYTFQIFFDFSAYSDMAIGLGCMFGFKFPENFDRPYTAASIRDFWRRWHISLSLWFRDYVYIPLGGNRRGKGRTILNLSIVWLLTGIWHGANWTFVIWGGTYGCLIIAERLFDVENLLKHSIPFRIAYRMLTFGIVLLLWLVFRSGSFEEAKNYISIMFDVSARWNATTWMYFSEMKYEFLGCVLLSLINIPQRVCASEYAKNLEPLITTLLFAASVSYMVKGNFSPFLYFNF